ncbi:MAG: CoA transferase [Mesorhizobium sp.]|nr:MAG: CoA transferase [Mesorhizobium sp.]
MNTGLSAAGKTGPLAGLGPVPLAGLMLSEMGAQVLRIERAGTSQFLSLPDEYNIDRHGRALLRLDLKRREGTDLLLRLAEKADILLEGFRPGVMERLGLGPEAVLARNPALIYGRMTGFGQDGPLAGRAGHDITYLAYCGVLHAIGHADTRPVPPLTFVADYGGGAMMLIAGVLAALFQRSRTGKGEVIDAAMVEGASMLAVPLHALMAAGLWSETRGENLLDSGAPFYDTYETADGEHIAIGCLEPQFFAEFARLLPLDERFASGQYDKTLWPPMRTAIADRVRQKSRDDWDLLFAQTDACVAPVLSLQEAKHHPHNRARNAFVTAGAFERPAPAPRFSGSQPTPATKPAHNDLAPSTVLARFGLAKTEIDDLVKSGLLTNN